MTQNRNSSFPLLCRGTGGASPCTMDRMMMQSNLTTIPLRSRDEKIRWLLGFRWGYREYDACAEKPVELRPLEITDAQVWNRHLAFLRQEFDTWKFKKA
jgi:hypothetical protein